MDAGKGMVEPYKPQLQIDPLCLVVAIDVTTGTSVFLAGPWVEEYTWGVYYGLNEDVGKHWHPGHWVSPGQSGGSELRTTGVLVSSVIGSFGFGNLLFSF